MQTSAPVPSETDKVRAALATRVSGFPLIQRRTVQQALDERAEKQAPRRFTGEPQTGFGGLQ